jgi:hypothetical protein
VELAGINSSLTWAMPWPAKEAFKQGYLAVGKGGLPPLVECKLKPGGGQATLPNPELFFLEPFSVSAPI